MLHGKVQYDAILCDSPDSALCDAKLSWSVSCSWAEHGLSMLHSGSGYLQCEPMEVYPLRLGLRLSLSVPHV